MVFKKGDVIAIIEVKSSVTGKETAEELCEKAIGDDGLKRYVEEYRDVYGVAVGFFYDPVQILSGEPGMSLKIEVVKMSELENG